MVINTALLKEVSDEISAGIYDNNTQTGPDNGTQGPPGYEPVEYPEEVMLDWTLIPLFTLSERTAMGVGFDVYFDGTPVFSFPESIPVLGGFLGTFPLPLQKGNLHLWLDHSMDTTDDLTFWLISFMKRLEGDIEQLAATLEGLNGLDEDSTDEINMVAGWLDYLQAGPSEYIPDIEDTALTYDLDNECEFMKVAGLMYSLQATRMISSFMKALATTARLESQGPQNRRHQRRLIRAYAQLVRKSIRMIAAPQSYMNSLLAYIQYGQCRREP
jgi:hypothetical protein